MKKWIELSKKLQAEDSIMGHRNTPQNLKVLYERNLAIIEIDGGGAIIAYAGLWQTPVQGILEAGSFWMHPKHRGKGIFSKVFSNLSKCIPKDLVAMLITHNEKVVHLVKEAGWDESNRENWEKVVPISASCGLCDFVSDEQKKACPYRASKDFCRMFFLVR